MDFDAVVIGSGAGGGAAAAELARAGRRVLVVERGERPRDPSSFQDERRMLVERDACEERPVELNRRRARMFVGGVVGGSTSLFGAVLLRPGPSDFVPGRHYGDLLPEHLWEWPIGYEELAAYFDRAEDLYGVSGDHRAPMPHLGRRLRPYAQPSPDLEPIGRRLERTFRAEGLSPFRLPLAIDFERCLRCPTCPGYLCPNGSRSSSWNRCLEPALGTGRLELWERCEARALRVEGGRVRVLEVERRDGGGREEVRAEAFLIGAGALGTPALLERSGLTGRSDQVGRNHMCHLGAVPAAVFDRPTGASERFAKQLGLSDFYLGTEAFPHKLGYAQAIPLPGPLTLRSHAPVPMPASVARWLYRRTILFTGSIEDLPQPRNRVRLAPDGGLRVERSFHRYDRLRARWLTKRLARLLRRAGARVALGQVAHREHAHAGHQVGTCRFGRDPRTSVLDAQCRLHGHDNVWVVDGSFMPTSLGVGPALTIVANALRVSDHVLKEAP